MGVPSFGQEHVDRYRETDGEEGHDSLAGHLSAGDVVTVPG